MRPFLIASFLLTTLTLCAQQRIVDSLSVVLEQTSNPKERVDLLLAMASASIHYSSMDARNYSQRALELAVSESYERGIREAYVIDGIYYFTRGDLPQALRMYNVALKDASRDELYAYTLAQKGRVWLSTATYDSAYAAYEEAIRVLNLLKTEKYLAYCYKGLARVYAAQWRNEKGIEYIQKAIDIYKKDNDPELMGEAYLIMGTILTQAADFKRSQDFILKGDSLISLTNDDLMRLYSLTRLGDFYWNLGDNAKSLNYLFQALDLLDKVRYPEMSVRVYSGLGDVYEAMGQNEVGLKYYIEGLRIAERIGFRAEMARLYSSVAWIYKNQKQYNTALDYTNKSISIRRAIDDQQGLSNSFNTLGVIQLDAGKYDSADYWFSQSLTIRRKLGDFPGVASSLFNKALVLQARKKPADALVLQLSALEMDRKAGNKYEIGLSLNTIGDLYIELGNYAQAERVLREAQQMAMQASSKSLLMQNYQYWSQLYEAKSDFNNSLKFHKLYAELRDSLYSEISAGKLAELQAFYQVKKKDEEIRYLNQQRDLQNNQIELQRSRINIQTILIISFVAGLAFLVYILVNAFRFNKKIKKAHEEIFEQKEEILAQAEELKEANETIAEINRELERNIQDRTSALVEAYKELDTFFYRASHDFRRPLTTFMGLAEVAKITVREEHALELFTKVRETAVNLDKMLVKLQSISDVGAQQLVYKEVYLREIIDEIIASHHEDLGRKHIRIEIDMQSIKPLISYPAMVKIILENLIENSIQFAGFVEPFIRIQVMQVEGHVLVRIVDNGQGIDQQYQDQVFDMYFRGNERSKGNGLGLYIVKKAVQKLNGSITFSSTYGEGTSFEVRIPNQHQL